MCRRAFIIVLLFSRIVLGEPTTQGSSARDARRIALQELKYKHEARIKELDRELRERIIRLSIDGAGVPSRMGAKEMELQNLLKLREDAKRFRDETRKRAEKAPGGEDKKLTDELANAETDLKNWDSRVDQTKIDLADLGHATNTYREVRDDRAQLRARVNKIDDELEELQVAAATADGAERKLAAIFAGKMDLFLSDDQLKQDRPAIAAATFDGTAEMNGRTLVRVRNELGTWTIDPAKILAVRSRK